MPDKATIMPSNQDFSNRVLDWFYQHGRHNLPWQRLNPPFDPYAVWVSEIMLQQTQVATVIGYYTRFMTRFKTLFELADAPLDEVIEHWAGLGYYARARNLHKTAQDLVNIIEKTNDYPQTLEDWQALSGIGQSTAGAIMAMGMGKFGVICDGNVKRVLARHFAIKEDVTKASTNKLMWDLAYQLTPKEQSGHYAQAMMDIGATICTSKQPNCLICPVNASCKAYYDGTPTAYPVKSKKPPKPCHHSYALALVYQGRTLFVKRPKSGIWGALWCLPLYHLSLENDDCQTKLYAVLQESLADLEPVTSLRHTLTHFHWQLQLFVLNLPLPLCLSIEQILTDNHMEFVWCEQGDLHKLAKPVAINKLLIAL